MKYRIRDFLWLALALGLGLGWYVDRRYYSKPKPGWTDFESLYDFESDYQFFEPAGSESRSGPAPFERAPHSFEAESRELLSDELLEEPRVKLTTVSEEGEDSSQSAVVVFAGCGGCFNR